MKKIFYLLGLLAATTIAQKADAQCGNGRYIDSTFAVSMSTVTYSTVYNQAMDIYQPVGDTFSKRPVIILGHGGAFITGNGDRTNDSTIVWLCKRLAGRGYVTASIDYRTTGVLNMLDSAQAITEVAKAISDGKAAIRYFVKDKATTNTYKIDTNSIFIGGNSAGAVLYMHVGYISNLAECPSYLQQVFIDSVGGFEGNSGNAGYTTRFKAVIDLAGGLNTSSFVSPDDVPSCNAQGDQDQVVPYNCAHALNGSCPVTLCGLGALEPAYQSNNIYHESIVFPGDGHVPWASDMTKFNTVDTMVTNFLYRFICGPLEVRPMKTASVSIYPNPATSSVKVESGSSIAEICVFDITGRMVACAEGLNAQSYTLNTSNYKQGVYFVKLHFKDAGVSAVVKKIIIE